MEDLSTNAPGRNAPDAVHEQRRSAGRSFRLEWMADEGGGHAHTGAPAASRDELIELLAINQAAFVVVSLMDGDRVAAAVLACAADVVRWDPEATALPRPILGLPAEGRDDIPRIGCLPPEQPESRNGVGPRE